MVYAVFIRYLHVLYEHTVFGAGSATADRGQRRPGFGGRVGRFFGKGARLFFPYSRDHIARCLAFERGVARDHFVDDYAEAEYICARIDFKPARLFGR